MLNSNSNPRLIKIKRKCIRRLHLSLLLSNDGYLIVIVHYLKFIEYQVSNIFNDWSNNPRQSGGSVMIYSMYIDTPRESHVPVESSVHHAYSKEEMRTQKIKIE